MGSRAEILDKLMKVKALADDGNNGGEKESARALLIKLMDKYKITDDDLNIQVKSKYSIE